MLIVYTITFPKLGHFGETLGFLVKIERVFILNFKDFFYLLKNRISAGATTPMFFRELMEMITDIPEQDWETPKDPTTGLTKDNTIQDYIKKKLSKKFATKIVYSLSKKNFIEALKVRGDDVLDILAQDYLPYDGTADKSNIANKLADEFVEIIKAAAGMVEPEKLDKQRAERFELELREKHGEYLLAEANRCCPFPGCGKRLVEIANGKIHEKYKVSLVDKQKAPEVENLIALCSDCYSVYFLDKDSKRTKDLKNVKKVLSRKITNDQILDDRPVEKGILKVITKIKKLKLSDIKGISYDPQEISNKISPEEELLLFNTVRMLVSTYYVKVREILTNADKRGDIDYEEIQDQMKGMYRQLKKGKRSKSEIFNLLTDKLHKVSLEDEQYCQIVIAYFVQSCEVYDAITQ